jgi:hypothetical protein
MTYGLYIENGIIETGTKEELEASLEGIFNEAPELREFADEYEIKPLNEDVEEKEEVEFTRATVLTDSHVTATEKKHVLHVVNLNDDKYFGKWLKVNRKQYMIKKIEDNVFEVTTRENRTSTFTGKAFTSDNTFKLKLA